MPACEIGDKGLETGRKRKCVFYAKNESEARFLTEEDGTSVEEIEELPPEPPRERQLEYDNDSGVIIPENASKSDLISAK